MWGSTEKHARVFTKEHTVVPTEGIGQSPWWGVIQELTGGCNSWVPWGQNLILLGMCFSLMGRMQESFLVGVIRASTGSYL